MIDEALQEIHQIDKNEHAGILAKSVDNGPGTPDERREKIIQSFYNQDGDAANEALAENYQRYR